MVLLSDNYQFYYGGCSMRTKANCDCGYCRSSKKQLSDRMILLLVILLFGLVAAFAGVFK